MDSMIPRERVLCALKGGTPDVVPFAEQFVGGNIGTQLLGLPDGAAFEPRALADCMDNDVVKFSRHPPLFYEKLTASTGAEGYGPGLIRGPEDLPRLVLPEDDAWIARAKEFLKTQRGDRAAVGATRLGISPTIISMGMENFSVALCEAPEFVVEVLGRYARFAKRTVEVFAELGFDMVWVFDDLAFKTGPMFSPRVLREVILPAVKPAADAIARPWILHSDGNLFPVLDDLLTLGMSGIHPIEPEAMDLAEAKLVLQGRACVLGNVSVNLLASGTPEEVAQATRRCLEIGSPGGGYVLSTGNCIPAYARIENVRALLRTARERHRRL